MKIVAAGFNDWTAEQKLSLQPYGISVDEGLAQIEFEVTDDNRELLGLLKDWNVELTVGTNFETADFDSSSIFVYVGAWVNGYPMPDNDGGYRPLTYDLENYCKVFGIGKEQKNPFRIRKGPNWRNKMMFELGWIYDEIFVKKELYNRIFKDAGVEHWPVLLFKEDTLLADTVQLKIPKVKTPLELKTHPYEICKGCERKKYVPQPQGFFPAFVRPVTDQPVFKSSEYFGNGAEAHNKIFMSRVIWE